MRSLEEIKVDVSAATSDNDTPALMVLANELEDLASPESVATAQSARGWAHFCSGDYVNALACFEDALMSYRGLGLNTLQASVICNIATVYQKTGDYTKAIEYYLDALTVHQEHNNHGGIATVTANLGIVYYNTGDFKNALMHYQSALTICRNMDNRRGMAVVMGNIGNVHSKIGDNTAALEYYNSALTMHKELGNRSGVARVSTGIGSLCFSRGDYRTALDHYNNALEIHRALGNRSGVAGVTTGIGGVYSSIGEYPTALDYFNTALITHREIGNQSAMAGVVCEIANVYLSTGDFPAALDHYHQALEIHQLLGERASMARVTGNIGMVFDSTGDYSQALTHLTRSLSLLQELGDRGGVALFTANLGKVHHNNANHAEARSHFDSALTMYRDLGSRSGVASVSSHILRTMLDVGDVQAALCVLSSLDELQIDEPAVVVDIERSRASLQVREGNLLAANATLDDALALTLSHGLRAQQVTVFKDLRDLAHKRNDFAAYIEFNNEYTRINEEIRGKEATIKLAMQAKEREIAEREKEHQKHIAVLHSTLPKHIADRVARGEVVNDQFNSVAVLFMDIVGFTTISAQMDASDVVNLLDSVFTMCDAVVNTHGLTKIKTIGDSYMAVAFENITSAGYAALELLDTIADISVRIGIHCGPVVAGVLGKERLQYDVWGDTVNVASRMESTSEPGRIHVSEAFAHAVQQIKTDGPFSIVERGTVEIKGKGMMTTYWLESASA